jgi:IS5 family transposase
MRFLGLRLSDRVPDSKTIWLFRQTLTEKGAIERLFERFTQSLDSLGLIINEGKIVDASFVEAPKQRNSREENAQLKEGKTPEDWSGNPHKTAQKDTDAKWTKKNNETHFVYKNHIKADQKSKLIENYVITDASVHDSLAMANLLEDKDAGQSIYADSAYRSEEMEDVLQFLEIISFIHEKGTRAQALTEEQKQNNRSKSKVRARIEHIFGFVETSMNGSMIRSIGIKRAKGIIGLMNLTYNMFRSIQIISSQGITVAI